MPNNKNITEQSQYILNNNVDNTVNPGALVVGIKAKNDTGYHSVKIDDSTHNLIGIDAAHHEIHEGDHYYIEGYMVLGVAGTLYVKLVTPDNTKWSHFTWQINSSLILTTTLVEAPTGGLTGGANVLPLNNNRNSLNASGMVITNGVTVPTGGTIISQSSWGGRSAGGSVSREDEIILKQGTTYGRTFLSGSASNIVSFKASWYEHTNLE